MWAAGTSFAASNATGTRASSQSMGLWRNSLSRGSTFYLLRPSAPKKTSIGSTVIDMAQCDLALADMV